MFELAKNAVTSHAAHPLLFSLFLLAGVLAGVALAVDSGIGNGVAAAFLAIYAILAAVLGGLGYAALFTAKLITRVQHRGKPS